MSISCVRQYSSLENARRLDAEFYRPELSAFVESLRRKPHTTLGRHLIIRSGTTPIDRDDSLTEGIVLLKTVDIQNEVLPITGSYYRISPAIDARMPNTRLHERDVLINIVGATLGVIGRVAIVPPGFESANITQAMALLRPKPASALLPEYVFGFLRCRYGAAQVQRTARPTGQYNLNLQELSGFVIPLVRDELQQAIRSLVVQAAELQARSYSDYARAVSALLSELGLQNWKSSKVVSYIRTRTDTARAQRIDAEYFQPKYQEAFGRLPHAVRLEPLGKLTTYTKGIEVGSNAYVDSGIPFWRVSNLTKYGIDDTNPNYIHADLYSTLRTSFEPQQGEMLLSKDATPGIAYFLEHPIPGIVSGGLLRLSLLDGIAPHYLEITLNSLFVQLQVEQAAGGSVIRHWKPSEVRKTSIPRLPNEKEKHIAALVQQSHAARKQARALLDTAKRAVETAIEQDETQALDFINGQ